MSGQARELAIKKSAFFTTIPHYLYLKRLVTGDIAGVQADGCIWDIVAKANFTTLLKDLARLARSFTLQSIYRFSTPYQIISNDFPHLIVRVKNLVFNKILSNSTFNCCCWFGDFSFIVRTWRKIR